MKDVSIISAVMNRPDRVDSAIQNWLAASDVAEIVIIDWSSHDPIPDHADERVRVIRVENEKHWVLTHAFNLAASLAVHPMLVKMDIDYRIERNFITNLSIGNRHFWRGKTSVARDENERHLCGFMACHADDFWKVGGYNERISGYGMDDWDIYHRMRKSGARWSFVRGIQGISHLPHTSKARSVNLAEKDIEFTNQRNKQEALRMPWTAADGRSSFDATPSGNLVRI